jgi:hypothetical protein
MPWISNCPFIKQLPFHQATALSSSNRPFIKQPPFHQATALSSSNRPFLVTTLPFLSSRGQPRDLQCAIRVPGPYRSTTSIHHHQILMEAPTSPLSFRVSTRGPLNCRSLGCPRDDKKGRVVARQGRLLNRGIFKPNLDRSEVQPSLRGSSCKRFSGAHESPHRRSPTAAHRTPYP